MKRIIWALCRQKDVSKYKESLAIQVTTVRLLLNTMLLSSSTIQGLKISSGLEQQSAVILEMQAKLQDGSSEQLEVLGRIGCPLPSENKLIPKGGFFVRPFRLTGTPNISRVCGTTRHYTSYRKPIAAPRL